MIIIYITIGVLLCVIILAIILFCYIGSIEYRNGEKSAQEDIDDGNNPSELLDGYINTDELLDGCIDTGNQYLKGYVDYCNKYIANHPKHRSNINTDGDIHYDI